MVESISTVRSEQGALLLPPGFRFHPTDEEVITSYLLQKFFNPSFTSRAVGEVDLNKCEPWDLPSKAKMGEKEWYFFCHKDMKYPTGMRTNRATKEGYWKATGKDKEIFSNKKPATCGNLLVGMKKTLVFYMGRAPRGTKTNWVMHEFRLEGSSRHNANLRVNPKDEWVVCKVFHKEEAKTKGAAVEYSAGTTANVSSVDAGEGDDDLLDSMIDPFYFNNSASSLPAKTTINTAAPYSADYSISAAAGSTSISSGSFVLPNYNLINTSNQQFASANSVPTSSSGKSSSWNMLPAARPAAHEVGSYNNNVSLHQDDHVPGSIGESPKRGHGPNSGVSNGLPSSAMAGVSKQNYLGAPQNKLWSYGHPYSSHLTTSTATAGSAENLGARLVHY